MTLIPGGYRLGPARAAPLALVLLPGIAGDPRTFLRQVPLSRRMPTTAHALPVGAGSLQQAAASLLDSIDAPRLVLLGTSLGGLIGWAMSDLAPERVAGLITLGTLPARACLPRGVRTRQRLLSPVPGALFSVLYRRRIAARLGEEGVDPRTRAMLLAGLPGKAVLRGRLAMIERWGLSAVPSVPAMWLRGQHDVEAPWSLGALPRLLPGVSGQPVPGGHRAHLTHPGALHGFVEHFVRGVR